MSNDTTFTGFNGFAASGTLPPNETSHSADQKYEKYRAEIADLGLTDAQETEVLQILGSIMWHFAKMGQTVDVCGLFFTDDIQSSDEQAQGCMIKNPISKEVHPSGGKEAK